MARVAFKREYVDIETLYDDCNSIEELKRILLIRIINSFSHYSSSKPTSFELENNHPVVFAKELYYAINDLKTTEFLDTDFILENLKHLREGIYVNIVNEKIESIEDILIQRLKGDCND